MSRFVIRRVPSGFKFDLKAANGQVVLTSEVYATENACHNGIRSIGKTAPGAKLEDQTEIGYKTLTHPKFELYEDKGGGFRFRLKARNGEIIGISESYTAKINCLHGIESVKKNVLDAEIVEE